MQRLLLAGSLPTVRQGSGALQGIAHIANNREPPGLVLPPKAAWQRQVQLHPKPAVFGSVVTQPSGPPTVVSGPLGRCGVCRLHSRLAHVGTAVVEADDLARALAGAFDVGPGELF